MTTPLLTIVDLETTGLAPATSHAIEIAWAIYSVPLRCVLSSRSMLIDHGLTQAQMNDSEKIHGITRQALIHGETWDDARAEFYGDALGNTVCGWNVGFDLSFLELPDIVALPNFDAMELEYPKPSTSRSLIATAIAHDVGIVDAHRALSDVMTVARLFKRVQEMGADLPAMIEKAMKPRVTIMVAETGYDPKRNEAARAAGFRFEGDTKRWTKRVIAGDYGAFPFAVREVSA